VRSLASTQEIRLREKRDLFTYVNGYLSRQSKIVLITSALVLVLLIGFADYITGTELKITIFYLLPISLVSWFVNRWAGFFLSVISFAVTFTTDLVAGQTYSHPAIVYWNVAVELGLFLIIVFILAELKTGYGKAIKLNADLQGTLVELKETQDQLQRKAQELACSNVELERFAYMAAHDLKGPLLTAEGYINRLGRLYKNKLDPKAHRLIGYSLDGMNRMEMLIDALLAYARVGTKAKQLRLINCNEIIELASANLQSEIEENCAIVTHDQLPTVLADDIEMVQLFQNLIGNGIKFRREEPPHVHISAEEKGKKWVICVSDNGIGIETKDVNGIFNIFERLHSSSDYEGNGIGLATCKKVVECHGGQIWVESEPGSGSKFYFTIPINE
jgi:signal transduction histidine kinase